jgi:DNA (cytosine-5)-methyltransferase 1
MKILNLYAGIGGNRKLWGDEHEVTAVEHDPEIAKIYQHFFPNDKVIVGDAHAYLEEHYQEFDFIWSSPPCPSHSRVRLTAVGSGQNKAIFPDMKLYEEILFLQQYFKGKWVVENVFPWYEPLIRANKVGSHLYWSNFPIPNKKDEGREHDSTNDVLSKRKGFDISGFKTKTDKKKILRNCVEPEMGLYIFNSAFKDQQKTLVF